MHYEKQRTVHSCLQRPLSLLLCCFLSKINPQLFNPSPYGNCSILLISAVVPVSNPATAEVCYSLDCLQMWWLLMLELQDSV